MTKSAGKLMTGVLLLAVLLSSCKKNSPPVTASPAPTGSEIVTAAPQPTSGTETPAATPATAAPTTAPEDGLEVVPPEVSDGRNTSAPEGQTGSSESSGTGSGSGESGDKVIGTEIGVEVIIPAESNTEENSEKLARIEELTRQVFSLQTEFRGKLSGLENQAIDEYLDLPGEERTEEKKQDIALKYYGLASELENQCDSRIDSICAELQLLLTQVNGEQAVVREIRSEYNAEKAELKDAYMSQYGGYLG